MPALILVMNDKPPILIVGGGLAGTAVAWRLWQRGVPFLLVDPDKPDTCSKIAAGLITPITGMRLNVSWRLAELLPVAQEFYSGLETSLGVKFHHSLPLVRLLKSERESTLWQSRRQEADVQPWLAPDPPAPLVDASTLHAELGGFQQQHSGWLDTATYLRASREFFLSHGCWTQGEVQDADLHPTADEVRWRDTAFHTAVLCRGADERSAARFFPWLQWDCARGVIARVEMALAETRIVNRGCWLLPRDGAWRCGSTYEFDFTAPLESSVEKLRAKLQGLLKIPFEITTAQTGIRPILKRKQLTLGRHPAHPRIALFNGLGSKGALQAPFFSLQLVAHLLDDAPLDADLDLSSNT